VQISQRKGDFREVGIVRLATDNPALGLFFELADDEQLYLEHYQWHFWIPEVVSFPMMLRCHLDKFTTFFPLFHI
jgi:hypothetical protein